MCISRDFGFLGLEPLDIVIVWDWWNKAHSCVVYGTMTLYMKLRVFWIGPLCICWMKYCFVMDILCISIFEGYGLFMGRGIDLASVNACVHFFEV